MIEVTPIDRMGTDLNVVNAARVSFAKESEWEVDHYEEEVDIEARTHYTYPVYKLSEKDAKLINYLAKHKHTSPFGHCFASFRVKAPLFCARQLVKHRFLRWNETSRRYDDSEPKIFIPDKWRTRAENVKQGSSDLSHDMYAEVIEIPDSEPYYINMGEWYKSYIKKGVELYNLMIENDVAPEQARMVLPQAMMTEWIWSGSLDAFASMCKLRLDPHTQYESRLVAEKISEHMSDWFPHSWKALMEHA